ncbi:MAG: flagellar basal body rod C-terminal domain-containing protein [Anaerovoracaceae bacterium]
MTVILLKFFTGGSIEGYLDLINGKGSYADTVSGENDFRGTLYYENAMNTFATNFASAFNDLNTIKPADPTEPAIYKPLFEANDGSGTITANNIRISADWLANSSYITTTTSESDTATGEGDNILRMISKMTSDISFHKDADPSSDVMFKGTFSEYVSALIGEQALEIELNNNFSDTATNVLDNLYAARESISGVSLDEEGINLMAYQKSYQAAARFFTVLDEAVDTIINRMGIVGR